MSSFGTGVNVVMTPVNASEPPRTRLVIVEDVLTKSVTIPDLANKLVPTSTVSASMLVALTVVYVKSVPLRVVPTPTDHMPCLHQYWLHEDRQHHSDLWQLSL